MEDSGIDSEDKQSTLCDEQYSNNKSLAAVTQHHMDDLEVVFRSTTNKQSNRQKEQTASQNSANIETSCNSADSHRNSFIPSQPPNTCRILQRKLELKVERAKRNYSQYQEEQSKKTQSATLVPINRLAIPGDIEKKPLVDYKSDDSDETEEISFFPAKRKRTKTLRNAELSDTFSIQEMTIESDDEAVHSDDSDASQNLELLLPLLKSNWLEKLKSWFTSCTSSFCS